MHSPFYKETFFSRDFVVFCISKLSEISKSTSTAGLRVFLVKGSRINIRKSTSTAGRSLISYHQFVNNLFTLEPVRVWIGFRFNSLYVWNLNDLKWNSFYVMGMPFQLYRSNRVGYAVPSLVEATITRKPYLNCPTSTKNNLLGLDSRV